MHYFNIKSKKDLIDYVKDDFNNIKEDNNQLTSYGKQIGGKSLPQGYAWGTFKSHTGYTCICFRKDTDEEVVLSYAETYDEMFHKFIELISNRWKLSEE